MSNCSDGRHWIRSYRKWSFHLIARTLTTCDRGSLIRAPLRTGYSPKLVDRKLLQTMPLPDRLQEGVQINYANHSRRRLEYASSVLSQLIFEIRIHRGKFRHSSVRDGCPGGNAAVMNVIRWIIPGKATIGWLKAPHKCESKVAQVTSSSGHNIPIILNQRLVSALWKLLKTTLAQSWPDTSVLCHYHLGRTKEMKNGCRERTALAPLAIVDTEGNAFPS